VLQGLRTRLSSSTTRSTESTTSSAYGPMRSSCVGRLGTIARAVVLRDTLPPDQDLGADGLLIRLERFDRDDEALGRFDELTAEPTGARSGAVPARVKKTRERRVRPNAATANAARIDAAFAARDADAFPTLLAERCDVMEYVNGATYDREGLLRAWRLSRPTTHGSPRAARNLATARARRHSPASGAASGLMSAPRYGASPLSEVTAGRRRRHDARRRSAGDAVVDCTTPRRLPRRPRARLATRAGAAARGDRSTRSLRHGSSAGRSRRLSDFGMGFAWEPRHFARHRLARAGRRHHPPCRRPRAATRRASYARRPRAPIAPAAAFRAARLQLLSETMVPRLARELDADREDEALARLDGRRPSR
jgi:hypothetical protein